VATIVAVTIIVPLAPAATRPAVAATAPAVVGHPDALGYLTGPDVSSWNHPNGAPISWGQVAAAGNSFAFVKATEGPAAVGGSFYTNPYFAGDFGAAASSGLARGAYDFARPALPLATASAQADAFVSVAGTLHGPHDLPPVLDLEVTGGLAPGDLINWVATWLSRVQFLTGRAPMIYSSPNFWSTSMAGTTAFRNYPLWLASWTAASNPPVIPGGWSHWEFWQFSDNTAVPGMPGTVDMNHFCCSLAALGALIALGSAPSPQLLLRATNNTGVADTSYLYGAPGGGQVLMCDWDGDGVATPATVVNGMWYVTNSTTGGNPQFQFGFGNPTDVPVCGDWNGDGKDTPGVFRNGMWFLTNTTGNPFADVAVGYGDPGDIPVVGDWNGDGVDTIGVVRNLQWFLSDSLAHPTATRVFGYGDGGDIPIVGDWDNNRTTTPGVVRQGIWYLSNTAGNSTADLVFAYGDPGDTPVTGRWHAGGPTTIGVVR
jgi:GH25 family lysozyme M1 (1,4-beta-N-acetylmuramidase)